MNTTFRVAPYSVMAWVWTITFIAAFAYFLYSVLVIGATDLFNVAVTILLGGLIVFGFVRSVRGYQVTDSKVEIVRTASGRINIDRAEIDNVEARPNIGSFFNMSLLGTGGLFGWSGKARVRKPGDINSVEAEVFGTNSNNAVVVELKGGRTLVLTPADPAAFVAAVRGPEARQSGSKRRRR